MPSSVIKTFRYDAPDKRLDIVFQTGRHYSYHGVPETTAEAMRHAVSKGEYFNAHIRDAYSFSVPAEAFVGTAGWAVPRPHAGRFGEGGSMLERYATRLNAVEINSSFYRPHRRATYERWAAGVPDGFRFSVKLPKAITHDARLADVSEPLTRFAAEVAGLGAKLAVILVQLPPSLAFDAARAEVFLLALHEAIRAEVAIEPRHASWFGEDATALLVRHRIARVAADPARVPEAAKPGGWRGLTYYRLHGSPNLYRSIYTDAQIAALAADLADGGWCIFDNTMSYGASADALDLSEALAARSDRDRPVRRRPAPDTASRG